MNFWANLNSSTKKAIFFIGFLLSLGILLKAIGDAQIPDPPVGKVLLEMFVGFFIGSVCAVGFYWQRSAAKIPSDKSLSFLAKAHKEFKHLDPDNSSNKKEEKSK